MKCVFAISFALTLIQWRFRPTEGLKCFTCVNYAGPVSADIARKPPDRSCELHGKPTELFLETCKGSSGNVHDKQSCGLIHIEGTHRDTKYSITVRNCSTVIEKQMGCSNITNYRLMDLLRSIGDSDLIRMQPNDATYIRSCTCDQDRCNLNERSIGGNAGKSSLMNFDWACPLIPFFMLCSLSYTNF